MRADGPMVVHNNVCQLRFSHFHFRRSDANCAWHDDNTVYSTLLVYCALYPSACLTAHFGYGVPLVSRSCRPARKKDDHDTPQFSTVLTPRRIAIPVQ